MRCYDRFVDNRAKDIKKEIFAKWDKVIKTRSSDRKLLKQM